MDVWYVLTGLRIQSQYAKKLKFTKKLIRMRGYFF